MTSVINVGSINVDFVYRTPHLVRPGETLTSQHYSRGLGGKGMNQSVAMTRAGLNVKHIGAVSEADEWIWAAIEATDVDISLVQRSAEPTGHAIIEVSEAGENRIILYPGANHQLDMATLSEQIAAEDAAYVLMQNETNDIDQVMTAASKAGKVVVFNPAPCDAKVRELPLSTVGILIVNEVELLQIANMNSSELNEAQIEQAINILRADYPNTALVVTLGANGVRYQDSAQTLRVDAIQVEKVVDTTAAGDTFIGYFMAALSNDQPIETALQWGVKAAAVTVSRAGAVESIPSIETLDLA